MTRDSVFIPDHPSQFSTEWLASKLNQPAEKLNGFTFEPVGTGQVGDSYRLHLDWNMAGDLPPSLVVKCPAADPTSRQTGANMHLYEIETRWYQTLANASGVRVPHIYFADIAENMTDFVLLMADCAPASQLDQMAGANSAQVRLALDEAARLHKARWNDAGLGDIAWLNYSAQNAEMVKAALPVIYPEFRERYAQRLSADILDMGAAFIAGYEKYTEARETPLVLQHGDFRVDNMLFHGQDRPFILDWQTLSAGQPMVDVAYCISTSFADAESRRAHEQNLVRAYLQALGPVAAGYDFDAAWQDYRRAAFAGFLVALFSAMVVERTERGDEMFAVMAERSGWQVLDLDSLAAL
ncbi:MAG: aminoglycoside phosphotransferase family protein [Rhodobiaceae bacterium]